MIELARDILRFLSDIFHWATGRKKEPEKKKSGRQAALEKTSEMIDEEDNEEQGDLTMLASKMLEIMHKKRKK